jgi:hypothetical protein
MAKKIEERHVPQVENDLGDGKLLASAIQEVADSAKKLLNGPLKMKAIVTLIQDDTKIPKRTIEDVLMSAADLARRYLK